MDFNEKLNATGHLEVIKINKETGEETVLFDDHNVITSGLGTSIARFMTVSGCSEDICIPEGDRFGARPSLVPKGTENANNESGQGSEDFTAEGGGPGRVGLPGGGRSPNRPPDGGEDCIPCYCTEEIYIDAQITQEGDSGSFTISIIYLAGCKEDPTCNEDFGHTVSEGGYTSISMYKCKIHGGCQCIPRELWENSGFDNGLTDPCQFIHGATVGGGTTSEYWEGGKPPKDAQTLLAAVNDYIFSGGDLEDLDVSKELLAIAEAAGVNFPSPETVAEACK